jgi:uncharacterized glyoxalase superfamily protein PhnB
MDSAAHRNGLVPLYQQVRAAGVDVDPPEDKRYGVRMLTVTDPVGCQWGFMKRIG